MYEVEATVTTATENQLELTGNWPIDWLQVGGSTEIQRKLLPGENFPGPTSGGGGIFATERREIQGNRGFHPDLRIEDRVIVRLFFPGESR
jgi:hypothetical protein